MKMIPKTIYNANEWLGENTSLMLYVNVSNQGHRRARLIHSAGELNNTDDHLNLE